MGMIVRAVWTNTAHLCYNPGTVKNTQEGKCIWNFKY